MNQIMKHLTLHQQRVPKMWFPTGVLLHSSYKNRLTQIIQTDSNRYHQQSNNSCLLYTSHVIGSHPHVVQPIEVRTDSLTNDKHLVVYSLGNYISNMSARRTDGGLMVKMELVKDLSLIHI